MTVIFIFKYLATNHNILPQFGDSPYQVITHSWQIKDNIWHLHCCLSEDDTEVARSVLNRKSFFAKGPRCVLKMYIFTTLEFTTP